MGRESVQVLVVGGGPIGALAARCAAEAGASVVLVERREDLDRPSPCTGLVSPRTLSILDASSDCVLRQIRAITVHGPDGGRLDLAADHTKAVVIDRSRLERELHRRAQSAGVDLRLGTEAVSASDNGVVLESAAGSQTVRASIVVGADGPSGRVAGWYGLPSPAQHVRAAQAVVEAPDTVRSDRVEVFLGRNVAPGFFAWAVPAGGRTLRLGLGVPAEDDPAPRLDRLIAARYSDGRVLSRTGGSIPVSPAARTASEGVLLVGDAAGQVKPLSGGGLYPGAVCARIAGRIAADATRSRGSSRRAASDYEFEWRSAVGREIAFGRSVRRIAGTLSDHDLSAVLAACDDPDLLAFLAEHADIDRFHRLPDDLAARPSLWAKILRLAPRVASREIAGLSDCARVASKRDLSL